MSSEQFDIIIIGSGPGGYVGAVRAAQLGFKVGVVEKEKTLGGTCLNVGCIPSKALLDSSEHYSFTQHELSQHGVRVSQVALDLPTMMGRKEKIVKELTLGIEFLFKKNQITRISGTGRLISKEQVEVTDSAGMKKTFLARFIVLATGSVPNSLPGIKIDRQRVITSTEALTLSSVPNHLIVVGGGVIGLELGSVWLRLGAQVSVIEYSPYICAGMDQSMSKRLLQLLKKQGMKFYLESKVTGVEPTQSSQSPLQVHFESVKDQQKQSIDGDFVLVATGRRPYSEGLGLETLGISCDPQGRVLVDDHFQTNINNIYAIGDLIRGPMLAHKAEEEGVALAEILAGKPGHVNYETVPGVIYTWPEMASVGATEEQLKSKGIAYRSGTFNFTANGRAKAMGFTEGQVKILAESAPSDRILGVHILGPRASDMIAEAVVAMEFGGSSEDLARSFHAHPTLSEVIREAALAVDGRARQA
ncbi:MAG: dihydrolipoyl dehydrogenase [Bdellovibrionales bacterium]|nr:dihydrolipoyl dehydrogenase [Bdellovibrionales bacterium]